MASTLPPPSAEKNHLSFIPPQRRSRTTSGKSSPFTPPRSIIYGDKILNVQGRPLGSSDNLLQDQGSSEHLGSKYHGESHTTTSMGTIDSIQSNGSISTMERVKREESNHSLGSQASSGQLSERSTDIDLVREAVHQKRSLRAKKQSDTQRDVGQNANESLRNIPLRENSSSNRKSGSDTLSTKESDQISMTKPKDRQRNIHSRPLPTVPGRDLPNLPEVTVYPQLQMRINSNDEAIQILNTELNIGEPIGGPGVNMTLRHENESTNETTMLVMNTSQFLTLTGKIKHGKNKGDRFDVHLKMNRDSLANIESEIAEKNKTIRICHQYQGIHILLLSLVFIPLSWVFCSIYAFYMGTLTWYNIFIYYNEQRSCCHKVFISPCVLLFYPLWIFPVTLGLGIYGGFRQVSWYFANWIKEVTDPEKGFYSWICNKIALPDCSPYQVVILTAPVGEDNPNILTSRI